MSEYNKGSGMNMREVEHFLTFIDEETESASGGLQE